ncbi:Ubiquitin-like-specific protease 1D [Rhynchospora pubera]|uniref:Ubiquitin-like-specific protease 1D n=1 Tax=Rhynchospora pubera TaxID=906938 RepID=A0AAV8FCL4_9POAL|nr:Ubiquitin-like-specific protease 1D [Rhynchospora pubera]
MERRSRRSPPQTPEPGDGVAALSDRDVDDKIARLRSFLSSKSASALPDKGEKIRVQIQQLKEEQDRRRQPSVRVVDLDFENCERVSLSKCAESSGSVEQRLANQKVDNDSPSSFAKVFNERFLKKEGVTTCSDDTKIAVEEKCKNIIKNNLIMNGKRKEIQASKRIQESTVSCRDAPFKSVVQISSGEKSGPIRGCNGASIRVEDTPFSVPSKRKRVHESGNSARSTSKKEVVLLDIDSQTPRENSIEWEEQRVYYPSREHPEMVELSHSDLNCLGPEQYLSSTVMNFYITYLQRPGSLTASATRNCYFFNTYFYNKLEEYASPKGNKRLSFLKLRRWWKGVNLFQKAYIFMPVHGDMHWSLIIICIPPENDNAGPIVLHLDSLEYHRSKAIFNNINKYLKEEWTFVDHNNPNKSEIPIPQKIWNNLPRRVDNKVVKVPQQENEYDCGLFVLFFIERFLEKAPERLKKKDLSMFGVKWFQPIDALALRQQIKCLLIDVLDKANLENGKPEGTFFDTSNMGNGKPESTSYKDDAPHQEKNSKQESTSSEEDAPHQENHKPESPSSEEDLPHQEKNHKPESTSSEEDVSHQGMNSKPEFTSFEDAPNLENS